MAEDGEETSGEESFETCLQQALNFLADRGFSRELRQEQKSSVKQLFTGNVLAVLPTGFGKSMIFQLLALTKKDSVILVICPLKSIVNDQIKETSFLPLPHLLIFALAPFFARVKRQKPRSSLHRNACYAG